MILVRLEPKTWLRKSLLVEEVLIAQVSKSYGTESAFPELKVFLLERTQHGENQDRIQRLCERVWGTHICFLIGMGERHANEKT